MISLSNLYHVVEAMVPLYAAMALGYASAKAKAFSPEQCAGINHFVAVFAIPLLTFRMISSNDPYAMNLRFLAADSLQKLTALAGFAAWARLAKKENALAWAVTIFSLVTLPNTIIMGVPVLEGMYGAVSDSLMAQTVVLQFALWFIVVVFLLEYMAAKSAVASRSQLADAEAQLDADEEEGWPSALRILAVAAKKILKLPNTYSSMLGFSWSLIAFRLHLKLPPIIDNSLSIISVSAVGLAMFSVGTFMARRKRFILCGYKLALLAMIARFVVGPAVMAATSLAVGLRGVFLRVGIVQAALPLAVLSFVYAEEYNVHADIMSTGVIESDKSQRAAEAFIAAINAWNPGLRNKL
ncbi:hypothetical protein ZIOFF_031484 [Zingiber officinale]|uniref:Auxin efflux carrier component n=1 Tax=Zingiber officinale TaxID=94328 RepID=A0A8J5LAT9_ZINOF|nr:hypothetical protein ZIOFF_031484 [Zingiber officinale]